jgi:hypothetical protein
MKLFTRLLAGWLVLSATMMGLPLTAHASLVSTDEVMAQAPAAADSSRAKVTGFFSREDVRSALQAQGVSSAAAAERVQAMTNAEVEQLASRVDQAPAGGEVLGLIFTAFIVLLVTDIMGLTKVFPFTRSVR